MVKQHSTRFLLIGFDVTNGDGCHWHKGNRVALSGMKTHKGRCKSTSSPVLGECQLRLGIELSHLRTSDSYHVVLKEMCAIFECI